MKWLLETMLGKTGLWLCVTIAMAAVTLGVGQAPAKLPEGDGKAVVETSCTKCHGLDNVIIQHLPEDKWKAVIDRMKGHGASVQDADMTALMSYLVKNFGPAADNAAANPKAQLPFPEGEGKEIVETKCTVCHNTVRIKELRTAKVWGEVINQMLEEGAELESDEVDTVLDYLITNFEKK